MSAVVVESQRLSFARCRGPTQSRSSEFGERRDLECPTRTLPFDPLPPPSLHPTPSPGPDPESVTVPRPTGTYVGPRQDYYGLWSVKNLKNSLVRHSTGREGVTCRRGTQPSSRSSLEHPVDTTRSYRDNLPDGERWVGTDPSWSTWGRHSGDGRDTGPPDEQGPTPGTPGRSLCRHTLR